MRAPLLSRIFFRLVLTISLGAVLWVPPVSLAADEADTLSILKRRAETGLPAAQYQLGNAYMSGEGVAENAAEAAQWYRKAAEQGHPEAQFNLGMMYYEGVGVAGDKAEAVKWYSAAANRGVSEAQFNLAVAYSKGEGVPQNHAEALRWYQTAAEAWDTRAQVQVGLAYRDGVGVQANEGEAIKWLRRAAYQNDAGAQYALSMLYSNTNSPNHNLEDSKRWLARAAELNYGPAVALQNGGTNQVAAPIIAPEANKAVLGRVGSVTVGTNTVPTTIATEFSSPQAVASTSTNVPAESTNTLPSNATVQPAPAFGQLSEFTNQTKLAEGGAAEAQWNIAMSFLMGEQGEADVDKAIPWLEKAAAQKHYRAEVLLRKLNAFRAQNALSTPVAEPVLQSAANPAQATPAAAVNAPPPVANSLGLGTVLMISIGSSILVIGGTAALIMSLLKSRFNRMQRDLLETKLELAEANKNVKKLTSFIQEIENKMLAASLEPPPLQAKAARPLPGAPANGNGSSAETNGVDLKAKRGRGKGSSEGAEKL